MLILRPALFWKGEVLMETVIETVLVVVISCLILALMHYLPWRGVLRKELPALARYMIGVLGLIAPISVVWVLRKDWPNLLMLWSVVICGGFTVILSYVIDASIDAHGRADIAEAEGKQLRGKTDQS